jgi:hypothetical protein
MPYPILHFVTLMLVALGMTMGAAHALELLPKMRYDPALYAAVTSSLYRYFGVIGGPIQIAAVLAATALVFRMRSDPSFPLKFAGALALVISVALWFALVQPVNLEWAEATRAGPLMMIDAYAELRSRWEYGHLAAFAAWFCGAALLFYATVTTASADRGSRFA